MADCLFCRIATGQVPSVKLYEDEATLAFLDINPLTRGHALVIPKPHAVRLDEMAPEDVGVLFERVGKVLGGVNRAVGRTDSLVAVHSGPEAGQEVPHVHVHLVPRAGADGAGPVHVLFPKRPKTGPEELEALGESIRKALGA